MNTSRRFLKADMNIQTIMLAIQLIIGLIGFMVGAGLFIIWAPIITFFLGVYQWGISGLIHITGVKQAPQPIRKWRYIHLIGSMVYVLVAYTITMIAPEGGAFIVGLIVIPQIIGYAYYGLTIWDYRLYNIYRDNIKK